MSKNIILYAPNIRTGGGLVLLRALLTADKFAPPNVIFINSDLRDEIDFPGGIMVNWVSNGCFGRVISQVKLFFSAKDESTVLYFHGIPPLIPIRGRAVVFFQNRLHFESVKYSNYGWRVGLRLALESSLIKLFRKRIEKCIVQTISMKRAVMSSLRDINPSDILVIPFLPKDFFNSKHTAVEDVQYDFIYPADGVYHKNHLNLLEAWRLLSEQGVFPSLFLTVPVHDTRLCAKIKFYSDEYGLNIINGGRISHDDVLISMKRSRALIFPSLVESFGLPLIEASHLGVPIIASELDFVWDVCSPVETFNPQCADSIAASVGRYLGHSRGSFKALGPNEFMDVVFDL